MGFLSSVAMVYCADSFLDFSVTLLTIQNGEYSFIVSVSSRIDGWNFAKRSAGMHSLSCEVSMSNMLRAEVRYMEDGYETRYEDPPRSSNGYACDSVYDCASTATCIRGGL